MKEQQVNEVFLIVDFKAKLAGIKAFSKFVWPSIVFSKAWFSI
jgi:hypothetical protein